MIFYFFDPLIRIFVMKFYDFNIYYLFFCIIINIIVSGKSNQNKNKFLTHSSDLP